MISVKDIENIKSDLGANYKGDEKNVINIYEEISSIASDISNRKKYDKKLFPYTKKATKAIYLCRGTEGLTSSSELGVSNSYNDIIEELRNNIVKNGLRRLR